MSKAISMMDMPVYVGINQVCCLCGSGKLCEYTIARHREVIFCGTYYCNIPNHIPREQDSQYVLAKIKEKL